MSVIFDWAGTLTTADDGWQGYSLRFVIPPSELSASPSGLISLRFNTRAGTTSGQLDSVWVGEQASSGDPYDMNGSQVQLKFGGANTRALSGAEVFSSDPVAFTYDASKSLVVSAHFSGTTVNLLRHGHTGINAYYKLSSDESGTSNVSGYSSELNVVIFVDKIDLTFNPATFDPSDPAASGFTLVFEDDFTSLSTIDVNNTGNTGYKWYMDRQWWAFPAPANSVSLTSNGLLLSDTISTCGLSNTSQRGSSMLGQAWGNGFYIECQMSFDPSLVAVENSDWPTFYGLSWELAGDTNAVPTGQANTYRYPEMDVMEYGFFNSNGAVNRDYFWQTQHDWFYYNNDRGTLDDYPDNNFSAFPYDSPVGNEMHTYGELWIPSTPTSNGILRPFIDNHTTYGPATGMGPPGNPYGDTYYAHGYANTYPPSGSWPLSMPGPNGSVYGIYDSAHFAMVIGGNSICPITVRYVRVWQLPDGTSVGTPGSGGGGGSNTIAIFDWTGSLTSNSTGWEGYNFRLVIPSAELSASPSGNVVVTLVTGANTSGTLDAAYIGEVASSGDEYDMSGSQVQLKFGGANTRTLTGAEEFASDPVAFTYDSSKKLIVSMHFSGNNVNLKMHAHTGITTYYKLGSNEVGTSNVSSYSASSNWITAVEKIEITS